MNEERSYRDAEHPAEEVVEPGVGAVGAGRFRRARFWKTVVSQSEFGFRRKIIVMNTILVNIVNCV
jgi:hypothetical protein